MSATLDDLMTAINGMAKTLGDCMAAVTKASTTPPPPPAPDADKDGMKSVRAEIEKLSSTVTAQEQKVKDQETRLAALNTENANLKKERSLLGLSFKATPEQLASLKNGSAEDVEKFASGAKSYLELVDERVATEKCKRSDAHTFVQRASPDAYRLHLRAKGVYDPAKAKKTAA